MFNFSLPEDPTFPGSLEAVLHHNPFRHNFEQLNASRAAAAAPVTNGDYGAYGFRIGTSGSDGYPEDHVGADLPAEDPWRLDLEDPAVPVHVAPEEPLLHYQRRHPVAGRTRTGHSIAGASAHAQLEQGGYGNYIHPGKN